MTKFVVFIMLVFFAYIGIKYTTTSQKVEIAKEVVKTTAKTIPKAAKTIVAETDTTITKLDTIMQSVDSSTVKEQKALTKTTKNFLDLLLE